MTGLFDKDELGSRMKKYEFLETTKTLSARLPLYARLDGRGFSRLTKGLERPFDADFSNSMIETTRHVMSETGAAAGYTQSDEISLVWAPLVNEESSLMFDGKIQKLISILASMTSVKFMSMISPQLQSKLPHFDCRIMNLPDKNEACNMIAWREIDAKKNAISMAARCHFSHKELQNKSGKNMLEMLSSKGVTFENYPRAFRMGSLFIKKTEFRELTSKELDKIPFKYWTFNKIRRNSVAIYDETSFSHAPNKIDVIFNER